MPPCSNSFASTVSRSPGTVTSARTISRIASPPPFKCGGREQLGKCPKSHPKKKSNGSDRLRKKQTNEPSEPTMSGFSATKHINHRRNQRRKCHHHNNRRVHVSPGYRAVIDKGVRK